MPGADRRRSAPFGRLATEVRRRRAGDRTRAGQGRLTLRRTLSMRTPGPIRESRRKIRINRLAQPPIHVRASTPSLSSGVPPSPARSAADRSVVLATGQWNFWDYLADLSPHVRCLVSPERSEASGPWAADTTSGAASRNRVPYCLELSGMVYFRDEKPPDVVVPGRLHPAAGSDLELVPVPLGHHLLTRACRLG